MAKVQIFRCDICQKEIRWGGWENSPGPVECTVPGGSTQFKRRFAEVCDPCGRAVVAAFNEAVKILQPVCT